MDKDKIIKMQSEFILGFFNDKRINDEVKMDWMVKFNELKIKIENEK